MKENLSQGIRLFVSRVVTFVSVTETSAVPYERLIAGVTFHCSHRSGIEVNKISTIFVTVMNIVEESL